MTEGQEKFKAGVNEKRDHKNVYTFYSGIRIGIKAQILVSRACME